MARKPKTQDGPVRASRGNGKAQGSMDVATADTDDSGVGAGEPLTNIEALHACIQYGFGDLYVVEKQIKAKEAEHLKALKDQRTKLWRNLKADTGITRKLLNADYQRYKLVRQASEGAAEDESATLNETLDNLRTVHMALHQGETTNWLVALGVPEATKAEGEPESAEQPSA